MAESVTTENTIAGNRLPTSGEQVGVIARFELLNYFRSRRFFILLAIDLIICVALTAVVAYKGIGSVATNPTTGALDPLVFYRTWWGASATILVFFSAVFFGGDAISGEFQNKTGYFLVSNPIRRSSIYVGKWIAALVASLIIIAIFTVVTIVNAMYYFGVSSGFPWQFQESFVFTLVYLIAALGFTFFFSSLFKSSAMSILVTAILLLFGFMLIDTLVTDLLGYEPWFSLVYGSGIISNILSNPYPAHSLTSSVPIGRGRTFTTTTYSATVVEGLVIMLVYFAWTAVLGLLLFERKEFT
jgi:ABC-2 type transport system permease protein